MILGHYSSPDCPRPLILISVSRITGQFIRSVMLSDITYPKNRMTRWFQSIGSNHFQSSLVSCSMFPLGIFQHPTASDQRGEISTPSCAKLGAQVRVARCSSTSRNQRKGSAMTYATWGTTMAGKGTTKNHQSQPFSDVNR